MVKLVYITGDPVGQIAYASRFSTASQAENIEEQIELSEDNEKLVRKLIKREHFGCIEFADATFEITCSRSASHQIVRHRLFSYVQLSQRYVKNSGEIVVPPDIIEKGLEENFKQINGYIQEIYEDLLIKGIKKEDARFILPTGTQTKLIMKGNFRSWREFLILRLDKHAQWEIRKISEEIFNILYEKCPVIFEDIGIQFNLLTEVKSEE